MARVLVGTLLVLVLNAGTIRAQDKEYTGKVKAVDAAKSTFTITAKDGKDMTFLVTKDTKFVGPRGGVSKEGLKDDRMVKGNEVAVKSADGKTAKEVKLPVRKSTTPPKDK